MAPLRPTLTLVRRTVGGAAVLFLLTCAVVFYREAPSVPSYGSSPSTTAPSPAPTTEGTQETPSGGPSSSADPSRASPTTTTSAGGSTGPGPPEKEGTIQLAVPPTSAKPFQTIPIHGRYRGAVDTFLRVQLWDEGTWQAFPLPAKTDRAGQFTAYVELGRPGRYQLRVLDPDSGVMSEPFVLVIKS